LIFTATVPRCPRKLFWIRPVRTPSTSSCSNSIVTSGRASGSASHERMTSRSFEAEVHLRVSTSSIARWIVDLPASFGPRTTVSPRPNDTSSAR
jgi:hypothetical protein